MTNDEIRMTKEAQMTNDEIETAKVGLFRRLSFDI